MVHVKKTASRMVEFLTGALLATAPAAASAAEWRVATFASGDQGRSVVFVDLDSLRRSDGAITFRSQAFTDRETDGYDRILTTSVVDCVRMSVNVIRSSYFRGEVPVGFSAVPQQATYYSEATANHWLLRRVCTGEFLSEAVRDPARRSADLFANDWTPLAVNFAFGTAVRPSSVSMSSAWSTNSVKASR